jgi:hypothetical protein
MRGVIDHCNYDNPYKNNLTMGDYTKRLWGYGAGFEGDDFTWISNLDSILGKYDTNPDVVYIEDCNFRRHRHEIAANGGAHYVARHNTFTEMLISWYASYLDAHGSTGGGGRVGTRLVEIYDNLIINSPTDNRSLNPDDYYALGYYLGIGVKIRGGAAMIFNNTFRNFQRGYGSIQLASDATNPICRPNDIYIWGNTYVSCTDQLVVDQSGSYSITEGVNYYQYARSGYVPYPYPHPLVLAG